MLFLAFFVFASETQTQNRCPVVARPLTRVFRSRLVFPTSGRVPISTGSCGNFLGSFFYLDVTVSFRQLKQSLSGVCSLLGMSVIAQVFKGTAINLKQKIRLSCSATPDFRAMRHQLRMETLSTVRASISSLLTDFQEVSGFLPRRGYFARRSLARNAET